jgi:hypothetical protein
MTEAIRGKVARILNSRELALNIGSSHGVEVGMYFDVLDPKGENITDPDTGETLGSVERSKVRIKVIRVMENLSVASTFKRKKSNIGGSGLSSPFDLGGSSLSKLFLPPEYVVQYETLRTQEKTWEDLSEEQRYVKTGDPVVQVMVKVDESTELG